MNKRTIIIVLALTLTLLSGCNEKQQKETEMEPATETSVAGISESGDEEIGTQEAQNEEEQEAEAQIEQSIGDLKLGLPEDFVAYEGEEGMYVCRTYPREIACISYMISKYDGVKGVSDKENYAEQLMKTFLDSYGEVVMVDVNDFWEYEVDGREVIEIESTYMLFDTVYEQLQLLIYDEEMERQYTINYMQEIGNGWMDAFRRSAKSISFIN